MIKIYFFKLIKIFYKYIIKMDMTTAFVYLVLTLILTTLIFVILNNSKGIFIPSLQSQVSADGYGNLIIALGISLAIVLFFILFRSV